MSFAIKESELFPFAIKRIAVEQIDLACNNLGACSEDLNKSIHAARQSLKRLRALVALAREELGDKVFDHEWNCYKSAGRLLADARDASAVLEVLDELERRFFYEAAADVFASERSLLAERRDARLKIMVEEEEALKRASEMLALARERVATWPVKHEGFKTLRQGLRRSYRRGREGLQNVVRHPSPANFHEWRRPAKLLWHQLQILTPIWPPMLSAHGEELHALSDRLNENHDLYLLQQVLQSQVKSESQDCQPLIRLAERRCRELQAEALSIGERVYAEQPRAFTARIERYWRAWKHGSWDGANLLPVSRRDIVVSIGAQAVSAAGGI